MDTRKFDEVVRLAPFLLHLAFCILQHRVQQSLLEQISPTLHFISSVSHTKRFDVKTRLPPNTLLSNRVQVRGCKTFAVSK